MGVLLTAAATAAPELDPRGRLGSDEAQARASVASIVVNRDGRISPRQRTTQTALCPRGFVAFTWGFRTLNPNPSGFINAVFHGARPFLQATGGVSGWAATFSNPNATPTFVRLSVTCVRPSGMDVRLQVGRRGVVVRGATAGGASAARAARPELSLSVVGATTRINPGGRTVVRQFCSGAGGPRRVPVSSSFTVNGARLGAGFPVASGSRFGWRAEFGNPTGEVQSVESQVVCAEGRRMTVSMLGAGRGAKPLRTAAAAGSGPRLVVDGAKTFDGTVSSQLFGFRGTCAKGLFSQWGFDADRVADPLGLPLLLDWNPFLPSGQRRGAEAMSRFISFDYGDMRGARARFQPLCVKGKRHRVGEMLQIFFD